MGSPAVAAWIAQIAFVVLLVLGWAYQELGPRTVVVFLAIWVVGFLARSYVPSGGQLFTPYVAILDIVLVFKAFKGDVRIT